MRLNSMTSLMIMAAALSGAADVIMWAWVGHRILPVWPPFREWLAFAGPQLSWLTASTARTLGLLLTAAWVEALSRIHDRLRARRLLLIER